MAKRAAKCPRCGERVEVDVAAGDRLVCPHCQAPLKVADGTTPLPPDASLVGGSIGPFEIVEELGRDDTGVLYRARESLVGRPVALRLVSEELSRDPAFAEAFVREARAALAASHPNLVEVRDAGQAGGLLYIATELVEGESLADRLAREGRLSADAARDLMAQTAGALAAAHAAGLSHLAIQPSNILLTPAGQAKLAGLGTPGRHVAGERAADAPPYYPPEAGRGRTLDARSDLYLLGATFYHALAGHPPFEADSPEEAALRALREEPPRLDSVVGDVPSALCKVIHQLLHRVPEARYATADEVVQALAAVRSEGRPAASAAAPRPRVVAEPAPPLVQEADIEEAPTADSPAPPAAPAATAEDETRAEPEVAAAARRRALVIAGGGVALAAALVLVALVSRGGRPPARVAARPLTRAPAPKTTAPPPPPRQEADAGERAAGLVLAEARGLAAKAQWASVLGTLDRLAAQHSATKVYAESRRAVLALRGRAAARAPSAPRPPEPAPPSTPDDANWGDWQALFDGNSLSGWVARTRAPGASAAQAEDCADRVHVLNGQMLLEQGEPRTGITRVGPWPEDGYEVALDVVAFAGDGEFCTVTLPVGGAGLVLALSLVPEHALALGATNGTLAFARPMPPTQRFELGRWRRLRVRVAGGRVAAHVDGEEAFSLSRRDPALAGLLVPAESPTFAIATVWTTSAVRNIRLRRLKPAVPRLAADGSTLLFDGKSLTGWRRVEKFPVDARWTGEGGQVRVADGRIVLETGDPFSGIVWTGEWPAIDYELALETMRLRGPASVADVCFPVRDKRFALFGSGGTPPKPLAFKSRRWYRVRLRVTASRIRAWVDDEAFVDVATASCKLPLPAALAGLRPLGLFTHGSAAAVRNLRLRRVEPEPPPVAVDPRKKERERLRRLEAQFAKAVLAADALGRQWRFREAAATLDRLSFRDPEPTEWLAARRDAAELLAKLKARLIDRVRTARPRLSRASLRIPGVNATLEDATAEAIVARLPGGTVETHPWPELPTRSVQQLVLLSTPPRSSDAWVAASLLALLGNDVGAAYRFAEKAHTGGALPVRHLEALAPTVARHAEALLDGGDLGAASAALDDLAKHYGETRWVASHADAIEALKARLEAHRKQAAASTRAEKLYRTAVELYKARRYQELKPVLRELQADHPHARAVTDRKRKPSVAEMARAMPRGRTLRVRQDGRGDYRTIQAAIDEAKPHDTVLIGDSEVYRESIEIFRDKFGLTLCGAKDAWPLIVEGKNRGRTWGIVEVAASGVAVSHVCIANRASDGQRGGALVFRLGAAAGCVRSVLLFAPSGTALYCEGVNLRVTDCLLLSGRFVAARTCAVNGLICPYQADFGAASEVTNAVIGTAFCRAPLRARFATFVNDIFLSPRGDLVADSVVGVVRDEADGAKFRHCLIGHQRGPRSAFRSCATGQLHYRDPPALDYRLKPRTSRVRASDGGDVGVRYSRALIALVKKAHELRDRGLVEIAVPSTEAKPHPAWQRRLRDAMKNPEKSKGGSHFD